ncbi:aldolase [Pacificimonas flava]|uniref:Aldolase n=2 Tax=Pacificimonas TaxID=1960290 RepID=A0A219B3S1_9SPHN|nr:MULTISPECIES: DUF1476 domain-containing protein [Pacificimonas]MBZ6377904.1 DUF1476 domain-containing protein [Pacificimonas aurantium]OWV32438.1 aldolase [Pacificimonas flava]
MSSSFDERKKSFEAKFAKDAELQFKVTARRNRLLGEWAADRLDLTPEERDAYAKSVVAADFEEVGDEDVFRKVWGDLNAKDTGVTEAEVREAMSEKMVEARRQFIEQA